jgi:putative ABC transport system permease protein
MQGIAWRNLKRNKTRMIIVVLGVVFAVVLVTVEVGMLLGLVRNASILIDRSSADIWVSTIDVKTFDFATPVAQRKKYLIQSVPGVERVEEFNVSYSVWKLPSGGNANVQVVAFDPWGQLASTLQIVEGRLDDLHNQDAVIIDEGEREKLGNPRIGEYVEIFQRRAKVVGITRGMRSFTTTPYVFTSLSRGGTYGWLTADAVGGDKSIYLLVRIAAGHAIDEVRRAIQASVPDIEAHTRDSFSWRTRRYWLLETGVGLGFLAAAFLGLLVGGAIVSQTLYSMTMERLPEFGVLKAMGASMSELSRIVMEQSLICGGIGLLAGLAVSLLVSHLASSAGTAVLLPWPLIAGVALLTVILCGGAALVSIARLRQVEPAMVFRT